MEKTSGNVFWRKKDEIKNTYPYLTHDTTADVLVIGGGINGALTTYFLAKEGIDAQIINIHTIKPIDEDIIVAAAEKTNRIFTVEEHSIIGGLGDAVAAVLSEKRPTRLTKIGVKDVFGESGPAVELLHKYELDAEGIAKQVLEKLK